MTTLWYTLRVHATRKKLLLIIEIDIKIHHNSMKGGWEKKENPERYEKTIPVHLIAGN